MPNFNIISFFVCIISVLTMAHSVYAHGESDRSSWDREIFPLIPIDVSGAKQIDPDLIQQRVFNCSHDGIVSPQTNFYAPTLRDITLTYNDASGKFQLQEGLRPGADDGLLIDLVDSIVGHIDYTLEIHLEGRVIGDYNTISFPPGSIFYVSRQSQDIRRSYYTLIYQPNRNEPDGPWKLNVACTNPDCIKFLFRSLDLKNGMLPFSPEDCGINVPEPQKY